MAGRRRGRVLRRRRSPSCAVRRSTCPTPTPRSSSARYTEYTGLRFALFLLAEYAGIVVFAGLTAVLFLGGWRGPFLEHQLGWLWTLIKVLALSFIVIWLRVAYPRLREDQLQKLAWRSSCRCRWLQVVADRRRQGGDGMTAGSGARWM